MRNSLLAAVAAFVIATPAAARDGTPYVGIEGGVMFPRNTQVDARVDDGTTVTDTRFAIDYKNGYDLDAIGGYDLGLFRVEGELGYKRSAINSIDDTTIPSGSSAHVGVLSAMLNGLVDIKDGNLGVYAGGGVGRAHVKFAGDGDSASDNAWAWQLIAGIRVPLHPNIDLGLKGRHFQTGRLNFGDVSDATLRGKLSENSLLVSLIYNIAPLEAAPVVVAPPPPPPAPPAPATQTCPDGSVILATDVCPPPPAPPAPPPPPPATKGERGR